MSFFSKLKLTVVANKTLQLEFKGPFKSTENTYSLDEINPAPLHVRQLAVGWALGTLAVLIMDAFAIWEWTKGTDTASGTIFSFVFLTFITLALLVNTARLSPNVYTFKSARAHAFLFRIHRSKPTAMAVDAFVAHLAKQIESYRTPQGLAPPQLADHFHKALDYLFEKDILVESEYLAATARLEEKKKQKVVVELVKK